MNRYYYIYVLRSLKDEKFYTGYTNNINRRMEEHNKGMVESTKKRIPFELVYWEGGLNQQDATYREKYLKTAWGKRYIKNRIKIISRDKTTMIYTQIMNKFTGVKSPLYSIL